MEGSVVHKIVDRNKCWWKVLSMFIGMSAGGKCLNLLVGK